MNISAIEVELYEKKGVAIVRNIMEPACLSALLETLIRTCKKFIRDETVAGNLEDIRSWDSAILHQCLIQFRKKDPAGFGRLYDTVQTSVNLQKIFSGSEISKAASAFLVDDENSLSVTSFMLRMDAPMDTRNSLGWHQDSSYFRQNKNGKNGLVCWVPMLPVNPMNGTLQYFEGSHLEGKIDVPVLKASEGSSHQYFIPEEVLQRCHANYPLRELIIGPGDAAFFNMDIIHRSGKNISEFIRFNAGARYHRLHTDDFVPGRLTYQYSGV